MLMNGKAVGRNERILGKEAKIVSVRSFRLDVSLSKAFMAFSNQ
jgi:hypothetical protein